MKNAFKCLSKFIIFFLLSTPLYAQNIKVFSDYPDSYRAGEEFLLSIRVEKGTAKGTGKLEFQIPPGFSVKKVATKEADFVFENNIVRYLWTNLPESSEFTVSFTLKADNKMRGKQIITGEFVYANGDNTEHVQLQPCVITITDEKVSSSSNTQGPPKVERKIVSTSDKKSEYKVELTIYPNENNEKVQFIDVLPADFSALVIDAHEGSFSFENQSVIFTWKQFPKEKSFNISYLVRSSMPGSAPIINGTLVYGDAAELTAPVVSLSPTMDYSSKSSDQEVNPVSSTPTSAGSTDVASSNVSSPGVAPQKDTPKEVAMNTGTPKAKSSTPVQKSSDKDLAVATTTNSIAANNVTASDNSIIFKVQISATLHSTTKNSEWFEQKYKIPPPVELTSDNGWKKYMIGSFTAYQEAKVLKNQARETISDAFIVAYQNGKRIAVSEAIRNKQLNQ